MQSDEGLVRLLFVFLPDKSTFADCNIAFLVPLASSADESSQSQLVTPRTKRSVAFEGLDPVNYKEPPLFCGTLKNQKG
ncbi:Hypothetical protein NTJ_12510 [Nesidiocoris tenuis]|uniref:Uncharacterized protein n=1 Tax=Nesidiocoris tenuis TaxID=355587 RepID=A0ABN7B5Z7_9HEMI|nr:Hypothetical protein NTJ_12510 [Nesidiocoris tenuis]